MLNKCDPENPTSHASSPLDLEIPTSPVLSPLDLEIPTNSDSSPLDLEIPTNSDLSPLDLETPISSDSSPPEDPENYTSFDSSPLEEPEKPASSESALQGEENSSTSGSSPHLYPPVPATSNSSEKSECSTVFFDSEEQPIGDYVTDIENGLADVEGGNANQFDFGADAEAEYTHVSIPFPGHNIHGICKCTTATEDKKEDDTKKSKPRKYFTRKQKVAEEDQTNTNTQKEIVVRGLDERREVPVFCAVCQVEYEESERIAWSSNPECTHVFHEDCIAQWLVTLGRTRSLVHPRRHRREDELNYHLECPCCRQDFIPLPKEVIDVGDDDFPNEENIIDPDEVYAMSL